jgi:SAM-dependent methyltransferase
MYLELLRRTRNFVDLEKAYLDESMRRAAPLSKGRLLDVGCGDKPYEPLFAPYVTEYIGIEYDETYSTSAYVQTKNTKADFVYSGDRFPFDDGAFQTVLTNQVAEHVPHPEAFFTECVRVLAPGGVLIVTVPFSYRIHSEPYDFHRFTKYALTSYVDSAKLRLVALEPRGGFWSVIGQKLTSHMALRFGRLGAEVQKVGGFGYEQQIKQKPRYWALPVVAPAIVATAAAARVLDKVDHDETDTIGYLLIAEKPA